MTRNRLVAEYNGRVKMKLDATWKPLWVDGAFSFPVVYRMEESGFSFMFRAYIPGFVYINEQQMRSAFYDALRQLGKNDDEWDRKVFATVGGVFAKHGIANGVDRFLMDLHRLEHEKIRDPFLVPERYTPGEEDSLYTDRLGEQTMSLIAKSPKYWAFANEKDELLVYSKKEFGVKFIKLAASEKEMEKMERNASAYYEKLFENIPNARIEM